MGNLSLLFLILSMFNVEVWWLTTRWNLVECLNPLFYLYKLTFCYVERRKLRIWLAFLGFGDMENGLCIHSNWAVYKKARLRRFGSSAFFCVLGEAISKRRKKCTNAHPRPWTNLFTSKFYNLLCRASLQWAAPPLLGIQASLLLQCSLSFSNIAIGNNFA